MINRGQITVVGMAIQIHPKKIIPFVFNGWAQSLLFVHNPS